MKFICLLFVSMLGFAAEAPKAEPAKSGVHLSDLEKAQLYKALAAAANAQSAAVQANQRATALADELTRLRESLEKKCGSALDEKPGELADCSVKKETAAK